MANLVAFQVEVALNPESSASQKLSSKASIHVGLLYFRDAGKQWKSAKWASRVLEFVVERTGLSLSTTVDNPRLAPEPFAEAPTDAKERVKKQAEPLPESLSKEASVSVEDLADSLLQGFLDDNVAASLEDDLFRLFGA